METNKKPEIEITNKNILNILDILDICKAILSIDKVNETQKRISHCSDYKLLYMMLFN